MIICGKRKKAKTNEVLHPSPDKNEMKDLERVAAALTNKYFYSVYPYEREDLKQTIWYLIFVSKSKYDPVKKIPFEAWVYYYADMKLRDHFWRGTNLPQTKGTFTLLHTKATKLYE